MTSANPFCQAIVGIAVAHGVHTAICSPGSRNAPLLLTAALEADLVCRVVVDERSAAFIALGEALVSRRPVMLICTSGTALLNYAPAVAEAFYAGIPLIVVSADRPVEWIDQDDSQTLRQFEALGNFVKKSYDLPVFSADGGSRNRQLQWYVERQCNDAMLTATSGKPGPVHINIQLDTPLGALSSEEPAPVRVIDMLESRGDLAAGDMEYLVGQCLGKRILLLAGFMPPDHALNKSVNEFARLENVAVMAETLSNLHPFSDDRWTGVDTVLSIMSEEEKKEMAPDVVITIGGAVVSRKVKEWLRKCSPEAHWSLGHNRTTVDCFQCLTLRLEVAPERFLRKMTKELRKKGVEKGVEKTPASYSAVWRKYREAAEENLRTLLKDAPWSDLKAFQLISEKFPPSANLFLSNGTAVRYDQLFGIRAHASYCNRGVSGIDGSTSTAIGGALAYSATESPEGFILNNRQQTVLITGDMSFAYDMGALGTQLMPDTMRVIILNNGGGGIFRFIGSTAGLPDHLLGKYFCADPQVPVKELCRAYALSWYGADSEESLGEVLPRFFADRHASVLEIITDGATSASLLGKLLK